MNQTTIIAHFSVFRFIMSAGILSALVGLICYATLTHPGGVIPAITESGRYGMFLILTWIFVVPYFAWLFLPIVWQLIFGKRAEIWIEGDKIHFYRGRFHKVYMREVLDVVVTRVKKLFLSPTVIALRLKDGTEQHMPTALLAIPLDSVVLQLIQEVDARRRNSASV